MFDQGQLLDRDFLIDHSRKVKNSMANSSQKSAQWTPGRLSLARS